MPRFSILTPVFNTPKDVLERCISSVLQQRLTDWEWCLVDDCSTLPHVRKVLDRLSRKDDRVRVAHRRSNGGIVAASQDALDMATGEFVALLDHDDELHVDALQLIAEEIDRDDLIDYLYTDEDKIDLQGNHFDTFRKPAFDPIRLLGQNYCSHLSVFRSSLIDTIGGFRAGFEGSQDYDLVLRATERARKVAHVDKVLYHWRALPGSTAELQHAKPYALESSVRAVSEHLDRTNVRARIWMSEDGYIQVFPELVSTPKVSIVIPTRGDSRRVWGQHTNLVSFAVDSVLRNTSYPDFEVVVVHDYLDGEPTNPVRIPADWRVRIVPYDAPFNFSDKCNVGAKQSTGEVIVLLNDDVYVDDPEWLHALVAVLQFEDVGMVGPLLLLEDGRIQSAGHTNDPTPHSLGSGESSMSTGLFGMYRVTRRVSGVTGACAAIPRHVYEELGGFSVDFPACFNDLDFGYKLIEAGKHIAWTPLARIYHFESLTRDPTVQPQEMAMLERRWKRFFGHEEYSLLEA